jgi:hypothetical protein
MPGRTPQDAIRAYIDPLQRAASCLPGSGKIVLSASGVRRLNDEGWWLLNCDEGLHIPQLGFLRAKQRFRLVATDAPRIGAGKYRVTNVNYLYGLRLDKGDHEILWHWHPDVNSPEPRPHMHLSFAGTAHLPCARHTSRTSLKVASKLSK